MRDIPEDIFATSHELAEGAARKAGELRWAHRHLLDVDALSKAEILSLFDVARRMKSSKERLDTLAGRRAVNLFYEASTRTRISFELAEKRLGADVVNVAASASSVTKGESLVDTVRTLRALGANLLVIRHPESGAPYVAAEHFPGSVLNAGDGRHAHPTQALLDAFTMVEVLGDLSGRKVVIVGDVLHSRVVRSNIWSLGKLGANVVLCGPPTLLPAPSSLVAWPAHSLAGSVSIEYNLDRVLEGADVVMVLRLQKERQQAGLIPSQAEYVDRYCLTTERLHRAGPGALVMHPGPMNEGVEIAPDVAAGSTSLIERQVENGVAIRTAVLHMLGRGMQ